MRMTYWHSGKNYERALLPVMEEGAAAAGIDLTIKPTSEYEGPEGDASLLFGITKREILWDHHAKRHPALYLDKGYCRDRCQFREQSVPKWWRMCWQDVHPTAYLMAQSRPSDRWLMTGMALAERRIERHPGPVVILGSSAKFHLTMQLREPTEWAQNIRDRISTLISNPVTYRPKPSWKHAEAIDGAKFDWGTKSDVRDTLRGAWCAVTYGSIACVDAICAGVPCIVVGNGVAAPISDHNINAVRDPFWASPAKREQWAANLAYCHFTPTEIGDGTAWKILKETMRYAF